MDNEPFCDLECDVTPVEDFYTVLCDMIEQAVYTCHMCTIAQLLPAVLR